MSSQDELLDELLRDFSGEEEPESPGADSHDIDDIAGMSEETIARLLQEGTESASGSSGQGEDTSQPDIMDLLGETGDSDLQDIRNMLGKSDRNEAIDETDRGSEMEDIAGPADLLLADIEEKREDSVAEKSKEERNLEKKRQKEEKAARKKAEREARRAQKKERKKKKPDGEISIPQGEDNEIREFDMSRDLDLLDSIVASANKAEKKSVQRDVNGEPGGARRREQESLRMEDGFENLLDPGREDSRSGNDEPPEIIELDMEDADAYIPDISESMREEEGEGEKKKGLFSKLVNILTEEEEMENEDIRLSEENEEILQDLDSEENIPVAKVGKKGAKKAKTSKKKKDAKAKKAKPAKPKKPPKPKKPKKPKEAEPYTRNKLTFKKMLPVLLLGVSVGAVLFLFTNLASGYSVKQAARAAYKKGDYQACYINLYGRDLNEEEAKMYGKSESILYMQLLRQEYELTAANGTAVEALDRLIQIVDRYPNLRNYAMQWNAEKDVQTIYDEVLGILSDHYGLTEAQAQEIAAIKSDIQYTRVVTALADGYPYGAWIAAGAPKPLEANVGMPQEILDASQGAIPNTPLEVPSEGGQTDAGQGANSGEAGNELPEESELGNDNFVDNR